MKTKKVTSKSKVIASKKRSFRPTSLTAILAIVFIFGGLGVYLLANSYAKGPVNVDAATYNILGQHHDSDSPLDTWNKRKSRVADKISSLDPGIIGMQEVMATNPITGNSSPQRSDVLEFMGQKGYSGYTGAANNSSPIFWKKDTFTVLAKKQQLIVPVDANAQGPAARYLTYVRLRKNGKNISVFNYHFNQFRATSSQLTKLKTYFDNFKVSGDSVLFTGDFNGYDLQVRNQTGVWRVDNHDGVDHVMASNDVSRRNWENTGKGDPLASDHPLIGVGVTLN